MGLDLSFKKKNTQSIPKLQNFKNTSKIILQKELNFNPIEKKDEPSSKKVIEETETTLTVNSPYHKIINCEFHVENIHILENGNILCSYQIVLESYCVPPIRDLDVLELRVYDKEGKNVLFSHKLRCWVRSVHVLNNGIIIVFIYDDYGYSYLTLQIKNNKFEELDYFDYDFEQYEPGFYFVNLYKSNNFILNNQNFIFFCDNTPKIIHVFEEEESSINDLYQLQSNNNIFVTLNIQDKYLKFWDITTKKSMKKINLDFPTDEECNTICHDTIVEKNGLLYVGLINKFSIIDLKKDKIIKSFNCENFYLGDLLFVNERQLYAGSEAGELYLIDIYNKYECKKQSLGDFEGHSQKLYKISDKKFYYVCSGVIFIFESDD